jgi:hypothetical protein
MFFYSATESFDHGILATGLYMPTAMTSSVLIMKTDSAGNPLWAKSYDAADYQAGYTIHELPNHNIVVTGYTMGTNGIGDHDAVVLMTDPNGNLVFEKIYGDSAYQWTNALTVLPNGNIVLCGIHQDASINAMLLCIDTNGTIQWTRLYGQGSEVANSITTADDGGIAFTGYTGGFGAGSGDIYMVKTDGVGMVNCHTGSIQYTGLAVNVTTTSRMVNVLNNLTAVSTHCTIESGCVVTPICSTVGIEEPSSVVFSVYPNPAQGSCFVAGAGDEDVTISILNSAGQEVQRHEQVVLRADQPIEIHLEGLAAGMYLLIIDNGVILSQKRIIIPDGRN